jgi:hypothetical protein
VSSHWFVSHFFSLHTDSTYGGLLHRKKKDKEKVKKKTRIAWGRDHPKITWNKTTAKEVWASSNTRHDPSKRLVFLHVTNTVCKNIVADMQKCGHLLWKQANAGCKFIFLVHNYSVSEDLRLCPLSISSLSILPFCLSNLLCLLILNTHSIYG